MKIGIIGSGMIGATLGKLWAEAGHLVKFSSRHPDKLIELAKKIPQATVGEVEETAQWAEAILLAVPFHATASLGEKLQEFLQSKTIMDAGNPIANRDGEVAQEALKTSSAVYTGNQFPGAHVVKAFNTVYFKVMESEAHRQGDPIGIPLAGDSEEGLKEVSQLVKDAGFGPVVFGGALTAKLFEPGTALWNSSASQSEVEVHLKENS